MQAISNGAPSPTAPVGTDRPTEADRLEGLAELASGRTPDAVERTLALAREALGMDVAFVSEFTGDRMEFRALEGDAGSFGWQDRRAAACPRRAPSASGWWTAGSRAWSPTRGATVASAASRSPARPI
jgi:hypothetical protein